MELRVCASRGCSLYAVPGEKFCANCRSKNRIVIPETRIFKSQIELFRYLWKNREHRCFVTGQKLDKFNGTPYFLSIFAHVLRKSAYPFWKLNPNNIIFLSPSFRDYSVHRLFDDGVLSEIENFEELTGKSFLILFDFEESSHNRYVEDYGPVIRRKIVRKYMLKKAARKV